MTKSVTIWKNVHHHNRIPESKLLISKDLLSKAVPKVLDTPAAFHVSADDLLPIQCHSYPVNTKFIESVLGTSNCAWTNVFVGNHMHHVDEAKVIFQLALSVCH